MLGFKHMVLLTDWASSSTLCSFRPKTGWNTPQSSEMEAIEINFPNEDVPYPVPLSVASKWVPSDSRTIGDVVFFNIGDLTISCRVEDYQKLVLVIQK